VRRRKRPHQPGAATRDPARLTLTSRRNTQVAANAPEFAFRQDRREAAVSQPRPVPDPPSARRQISLTKPPPTPESSRPRNHPNRAKYEIPIDRRRNPAGSCLGGFPTPDGIRKPSPSWSPNWLSGTPESGHWPLHLSEGFAPNLRCSRANEAFGKRDQFNIAIASDLAQLLRAMCISDKTT
jgi:hypothetical protein